MTKSKLALELETIRTIYPRGDRRGELSPEELIDAAIYVWARGDVFFRNYHPGLSQAIAAGKPVQLPVFHQPGTDHYFALPMQVTTVLARLGINGGSQCPYAARLAAGMMLKLDSEGFDYLGNMVVPIVGDCRSFNISTGRLGTVLKATEYFGFEMTREYGDKRLLIPRVNMERTPGQLSKS